MMKLPVVVLALMIGLSLIAPVLTPLDPMQTNPPDQLQPPNTRHFLGTDALGRDVFSRMLYGGQRTLLLTALATVVTLAGGICLGLAAGVSGGWGERAAAVVTNALLALPGLLLALVVVTLLGAGGWSLALATGLAQVGAYARVTRAALVSARAMQYVEAAAALGATNHRILWRHIWPNLQPTLRAYAGVVFSYNLLNGAALSFLGLGGEPGVPDWGVMLAEGRAALRAAPWISLAPGLAITLTVMAVNRLAREWGQHRTS